MFSAAKELHRRCMPCAIFFICALTTLNFYTIQHLSVQRSCFSQPVFFNAAFYSASALLAVLTAVLATAGLSVFPSVTFQCYVQMNEDTIVQASARTIILVSGKVKFIQIFARDYSQQGR